ncbi:MAG: M48 family metalloprotease [Proteobacteria bacterium]|nr:M48 family metalloprotease [Pseudomonadota bacterium]
MNTLMLLGTVLLACYGLMSLLLAGVLALLWPTVRRRVASATASVDLLGLRLLPSMGALLLTLTVVLPAFWSQEPRGEQEAAGPVLILLAAFAVACIGLGAWRAIRACWAARTVLRLCGFQASRGSASGPAVHIIDIGRPLVAVIGAWRPRIVAAHSVKAACDSYEFRQVLAHEAAHLAARDNLKRLLLVFAPDPLAWTSVGRAMCAAWQSAAEREADLRATGDDPRRRLALASALIKVTRLLGDPKDSRPALGLSAAVDDVPARVRVLLGSAQPPPRATLLRWLLGCALAIPLLVLPAYAPLHDFLEVLVRIGR